MGRLSGKERELVALGAALGSNCIPCIVYHVGVAKNTGFTDEEIREAVELADKIRMVPAATVLKTARAQIEKIRQEATERPECCTPDCGC